MLTPFFGRSTFSDSEIAEFFNRHHSAGRVFIERSWDILKAHFQCLRCLRQQSVKYTLLVVEACPLLHSFLIEKRLEDVRDADSNISEAGQLPM